MAYRSVGRGMAIAVALLLSACISHNIPDARLFTETDLANTARVFVDANGDFYPDNWDQPFPRNRIESEHSLRMAINLDPSRIALLNAAREEQLGEVAALISNKRRVFILVHGFNNDQSSAEQAFRVLRRRLPLTSDDAVIQFHWDGLVGSWGGQARMWFNAVGYSQVAGTHALRDVLRLMSHQDVFVISHSRGASVVLSALSDPAYDESFRGTTERVLGQGFLQRTPLPSQGNNIHVVLLAPAIGNPDFWSPHGGRSTACGAYRTFPSQVRSIRYTINPGDPVLRKPLGGRLASSLNATDLGYRREVGSALEECYRSHNSGHSLLRGYPIQMNAHPFTRYAAHQIVATMLADSGVSGVRPASED